MALLLYMTSLLLLASSMEAFFSDPGRVKAEGKIFCGPDLIKVAVLALLKESDHFPWDGTLARKLVNDHFELSGEEWEITDLEPYVMLEPQCDKHDSNSQYICCDEVKLWVPMTNERAKLYEKTDFEIQACRKEGESCANIDGGYFIPPFSKWWKYSFGEAFGGG